MPALGEACKYECVIAKAVSFFREAVTTIFPEAMLLPFYTLF